MNENTKFIKVFDLEKNKDYILNLNQINHMCQGEFGKDTDKQISCGVIKVDWVTFHIPLDQYLEIEKAIFPC